jgi:hypothetical protein
LVFLTIPFVRLFFSYKTAAFLQRLDEVLALWTAATGSGISLRAASQRRIKSQLAIRRRAAHQPVHQPPELEAGAP